MRRGLAVLLLAMVALFDLATRQKVPGVWRTHLPGRCELVHYTLASKQPERTITLDCPGIDITCVLETAYRFGDVRDISTYTP